jgi:hypothetical protein
MRTAQIEIEMVTTCDQDADPKDYLFADDHEYRAQDEARLKAWQSGEWDFIGVRAKATIKIPFGTNAECWITSAMLSPGLWGIESDSGDDYLQEVYSEEKAILLGMLQDLETYEVAI